MGGGRVRDAIDNPDGVLDRRDGVPHNVARRDIVVVGASAGGIEALQVLVHGLPRDLAAAVFIVLHVPRRGPRALAAILDRAGPLPVTQAEDGEIPRDGRVYVASPDHHLVLGAGRMHLTQEAAVNGHRPSIDALFRSAAATYGHRVVAIVLSGSGDDGSAGLVAAFEAGGVPVVQDPDQAGHSSMPRRARDQVPETLVRPVEEIGPLLARLAAADPTDWPAPDLADSTPLADNSTLDAALWLALRALQERSALSVRMARSRRSMGDEEVASRYYDMAEESDRAIDTIRQHLRSLRAAGVGPAVVG